MKRYINILFIITSILFGFSSCKQVTVKLDKIPANTPAGANIYISGNFNYWDPGDARYIMSYDSVKGYSITLPVSFGNIEYKFTRGDWRSVESGKCGNEIENRVIENFDQETVTNRIESWADLEPLDCDSIKIIVTKIPKNTPKNDVLQIAGNFNAWNPANDTQYQLKKDIKSGNYFVTIKRKQNPPLKEFRYKIIRSTIAQAESDKFGNELEMRKIDLKQGNQISIEIENWTDLAEPSLNSVTIVLDKIPNTTPEGNMIHLVGNFNNWMPDDRNYIFRKNKNGLYSISIPRKEYGLSFKITRGSWETEAADKKGNNLDNQDYNYAEVDTIHMSIENWKDIKPRQDQYITVIIDKVPKNTPVTETLYLIGTYNDWGTNTKNYAFTRDTKGKYTLNLIRRNGDLEYKITRGNWQNQELNKGVKRIAHDRDDTLKMQVQAWSDMISDKKEFVRVEISKIPKRTPVNEQIYIAGSFNGWDPGDKNFILEKDNKGIYYIELPRTWLKQGFKFTRGSWNSAEGDRYGKFIENRLFDGQAPILKLEIAGWE